jgi:preprotein translocase subunit Sss1
MKGSSTLYDYRGKIAGIIISVLGIAGMVIERLTHIILYSKYSSDQHFRIFLWGTLFGFLLIMFSKERDEDERSKQVRYKSLQIAFLGMVGSLLSYTLVCTIQPDKATMGLDEVYFFLAFGILFYLAIFHVGLHLDFLWDYEDTGMWQNLKNIGRNKWGILAYLLICVIMLALLTLL